MAYALPATVLVVYQYFPFRTGGAESSSFVRALISAKIASIVAWSGANHASANVFSASKYEIVAGSSLLTSHAYGSLTSPEIRAC